MELKSEELHWKVGVCKIHKNRKTTTKNRKICNYQ